MINFSSLVKTTHIKNIKNIVLAKFQEEQTRVPSLQITTIVHLISGIHPIIRGSVTSFALELPHCDLD
jgi:hypothetical protein